MKHVDVVQSARHRLITGEIAAHFVLTQKMIADTFTKQLPGPSFRMNTRMVQYKLVPD
jgi:hypothetical protein